MGAKANCFCFFRFFMQPSSRLLCDTCNMGQCYLAVPPWQLLRVSALPCQFFGVEAWTGAAHSFRRLCPTQCGGQSCHFPIVSHLQVQRFQRGTTAHYFSPLLPTSSLERRDWVQKLMPVPPISFFHFVVRMPHVRPLHFARLK